MLFARSPSQLFDLQIKSSLAFMYLHTADPYRKEQKRYLYLLGYTSSIPMEYLMKNVGCLNGFTSVPLNLFVIKQSEIDFIKVS